jgi:hypothetical protein
VKGVEDIIKDEINPMTEVYRAVNINMKWLYAVWYWVK